ncbi:O-antigen ligase family protein [Desulfobulbus elongatus]|uniref:O-antigen ligase family protein n=1 Tax=Desulfobulbus elongatus TaxID=53332 RepID=UPI000484F63F|nr:O-antigen ligase family protein [Desulfobulbus elongatus]
MQRRMEQVCLWLHMALAFFLPLSTSAVSVAACLILLCGLLEGRYAEKLREMAASPLGRAVLVYAVVLLLGLCWTESLQDGLAVIRKQWKVMLAPFLLTTIRWEWRQRYVVAFIAGVTATMLAVSLDQFDLLQKGLSEDELFFHTLTIQLQYTPMLAFAIYLLAHQLLWGGKNGWQWWGLLAFAALLTVHLFTTMGRAGHCAFFVLMAVLLFQYYRKNVLRAGLIAAVLFPLVFTAAYRLSPVFQGRMDAIVENIRTFRDNPNTSVGLRLHYWTISWQIIRQSPWIGVGTGDFASAYSAMNESVSPGVPTTNNPHNQYVFLTVQLGVLGLLSLLGLLFVHFRRAGRIVDGWERIRLAFPVFFMVIMCFESYLNLVGTGFLFSLMSAILFKNPQPLRPAVTQGEVPATTPMVQEA